MPFAKSSPSLQPFALTYAGTSAGVWRPAVAGTLAFTTSGGSWTFTVNRAATLTVRGSAAGGYGGYSAAVDNAQGGGGGQGAYHTTGLSYAVAAGTTYRIAVGAVPNGNAVFGIQAGADVLQLSGGATGATAGGAGAGGTSATGGGTTGGAGAGPALGPAPADGSPGNAPGGGGSGAEGNAGGTGTGTGGAGGGGVAGQAGGAFNGGDGGRGFGVSLTGVGGTWGYGGGGQGGAADGTSKAPVNVYLAGAAAFTFQLASIP